MAIVAIWTEEECVALRRAYGMKQATFAHTLGVAERSIRRWEKGETPVGGLGQATYSTMLAKAPEDVAERFEQLRRSESDMKRREVLKASAIGVGALATLGLGDSAERAAWLLSGAGRPDVAAVSLVRSTLHHAMQLDDLLGSPAAQGMVVAQQQVTEAMLRDCPAVLRPEVLSLYAEWTGLAGSLAWDGQDYPTAARLYTQARENAHEAEDSDLGAYLLCHLSQLETWQRRPRIAVDYAVAARSWVMQSEDRQLRAYVAIRNAEAAAIAGQRAACLQALDEADSMLVGIAPCHPSQSRAYFMGAGIQESYRGNCLAILGDAGHAVVASRHALATMPTNYVRDRAVTLLELERALIQLDEIEEAASAVAEAAALAEQNRSPRLANAIAEGRHHLSPWADTRSVRELDAALMSRDIVMP
ncbi:helix-turn-helix domain-containing protein [Nocardia jiangxiensis]|uniref:helix-turn-helix domain-containing protein n=1 Tax=Nocardia jiangxiensis TaxID=282685 RepID=UPI0005924F51|nr:transcriptional regulator [Nocardia jiangxiensis]